MEPCTGVTQRENICTILCIVKAVLLTVVAFFVLYIPLGDPHVHCKTVASTHNQRVAVCYLCETYFIAVRALNKAIKTMELIICMVQDLLYEAKLKFYALLERIDRDDLCSSVCCAKDDDPKNDGSKIIKCPHCKCVRNRCRSKRDCQYMKR